MARMQGYNPTPGPQNINKYPFVGNAYKTFGEQVGFLYDPYSDSYKKDPRAVQKQLEAEGLGPEKPPGMMESLLPVAGVAGALYAGKHIGQKIPDYLSSAGDKITGMFSGGGAAPVAADGAATAATQGVSATAPYGTIAGPGGEAVGTMGAPPEAATGMFAPGSALSTGLGVAGVGLGAYGAYEGIKSGDPLTSGLGGAGIAGGLNALGVSLGPVGWGAMIAAPIALSMLGLNKPSIKEQVKKRWGNLAEKSDPNTQSYAQQYMQYLDSDQAKSDAKLNFSEMKKSGQLKAEDVWGGYGMFKTFGSDWLGKYTEDQRRQISQELLNQNLVDSKKGDIVVTDSKKAKDIASQVLGGQSSTQQPTGMMEPQQAAIPQATPVQRPIANPNQTQPTGFFNPDSKRRYKE